MAASCDSSPFGICPFLCGWARTFATFFVGQFVESQSAAPFAYANGRLLANNVQLRDMCPVKCKAQWRLSLIIARLRLHFSLDF